MAAARKLTGKSLRQVFIILSTLLLLTACASGPHRAPVQDRGTTIDDRLSVHYVSRGETLYAIAWRYGIDYSSLASRNGIRAPFTIYPGQKIQLKTGSIARAPAPKLIAKATKVSRVTTPASSVRSKTTTKKPRVKAATKLPAKGWRWRWPAEGRLLARYSSSSALNKGVDIAGTMGESVVAAAPGVVVYAGSGLRGYGNLLIIKHSERYLSAYAHNSSLLVAERGVVKAGQKIAEIGSSGTDKSKLHFEIRRDGKPVDPLKYLPKR